MSTIHAIYEGGVFKPMEPVSLPELCEVVFEPRIINTPVESGRREQELAWLEGRTDAEVEAARERLFAQSHSPQPIPEGKTLADMVRGQWPGEETDTQIHDAFERLS